MGTLAIISGVAAVAGAVVRGIQAHRQNKAEEAAAKAEAAAKEEQAKEYRRQANAAEEIGDLREQDFQIMANRKTGEASAYRASSGLRGRSNLSLATQVAEDAQRKLTIMEKQHDEQVRAIRHKGGVLDAQADSITDYYDDRDWKVTSFLNVASASLGGGAQYASYGANIGNSIMQAKNWTA